MKIDLIKREILINNMKPLTLEEVIITLKESGLKDIYSYKLKSECTCAVKKYPVLNLDTSGTTGTTTTTATISQGMHTLTKSYKNE